MYLSSGFRLKSNHLASTVSLKKEKKKKERKKEMPHLTPPANRNTKCFTHTVTLLYFVFVLAIGGFTWLRFSLRSFRTGFSRVSQAVW